MPHPDPRLDPVALRKALDEEVALPREEIDRIAETWAREARTEPRR